MAKIIEFSTNPTGRRRTIQAPIAERTEPLEPPKRLTAAQAKVWDKYIEPAKWLQDADTALAYVFTVLTAKFMRDPSSVSAAELAQQRLLAGDLGLRPAERQRLSRPSATPGPKFFS